MPFVEQKITMRYVILGNDVISGKFDGRKVKFWDQIIQVSYPVMNDHNIRVKGCQPLFTFNFPFLLKFSIFQKFSLLLPPILHT